MSEHGKEQRHTSDKVGSVMVVGAGIGGMTAALDLANAGFHVDLIEETTAIGGRMAQLDKTFPTNDCSMCTISPKLIEVDKHLNIDIITNADVVGCEGEAGNFKVQVHKRPRFVDPDKCNACGDCLQVCPVNVLSEFDEGTMFRKAIYKRYPQAVPGTVAISKANRPPCVLTCPASVNCQGYVALIGDGKIAEAYALIRERNLFPSVCGRVCHHPCEGECNRKDLDEAVAINPLKRFASDWVAAKRATGEEVAPPVKGEIDPEKPKVAVIGGGPAGMTAARQLTFLGYPVTLFEASDKLGGTVRQAIPAYRLPDEALDRDIADILAAGFEVKTGLALGRDFTLDDLKTQGYKAAFIAIGCTNPATLARSTDGSPMKGTDLDGVLLGLEFLQQVKTGRGPKLSGKVLVIGGGNVAIDVAMTAKRQGADEVEVISLECREEMPAHDWEIRDAVDEGIKLNPAWGPKEILGQNGKVTGVKLEKCSCVFNEEGRFAPEFDEACLDEAKADTVIIAIGQRSDFSFLQEDDPLWDRFKRLIHADPLTLQTNLDWVFAGGDMFTGPKSVVEAIQQGHEVTESIDRFLTGKDLQEGREKEKPEPAPMPDGEFDEEKRAVPKKVLPADRKGYQEIELTLDEETAIAEAKRCLACGICSMCLQCVEACSAEAIFHDMEPEDITLNVGSILLTPGFEPFDPIGRDEYGHSRYLNVITSMEFERILSASGPFQGHVYRMSDLKPPKRMAWIQCVGSRDAQLGNDYCSGVCCMYAVKEAIMAVDHVPGLEATVFYNDIRAYGKGFEAYYEGAKENYGVKFKRGIISSVKEKPQNKNLILNYVTEDGQVTKEEFDLVVLSVGLRPTKSTGKLAEALGVELNRFGFCQTDPMDPSRTSKEGIYVAGAFAAPIDIPETVIMSSAAAAMAGETLKEVRGTMVHEKTYPEERDVSGEEPRIGVFICRCGTNIARAVNVPRAVEYAKTLPYVVHAEENLYTCSTDTQTKITNTIIEQKLNRVVVASCTPRTHEPLFQETLRDANLNKYLFEMANIRDQCSWVHFNDHAAATFKAKDLIRMAVARAATLYPVEDIRLDVDQRAIVIGGGIAGMTAALSVAEQGFEVSLIEREAELGGVARRIHHVLDGPDPQVFLLDLTRKVQDNKLIHVYTGAEMTNFSGYIGNFKVDLQQGEKQTEVGGGAVIVATGGAPYEPTEYGYPDSDAIITQLELEEKLKDPAVAKELDEVVMIQCVGSREPDHQYCSRVCCQEAVKNALRIKQAKPEAKVYILFRDVRTYGFDELHYQKAREAGVVFIRFDADDKPVVSADGRLRVIVKDDVLGLPVELNPNLVVLSAAIRPHPESQKVSQLLKVPLTADGFFLEAHVKLRPLDFGSDGIFLAGLAHSPKSMAESISQAKGAASRAATIISHPHIYRSGVISEIDQDRCAACLTCVRLCPYNVPVISEDGVAFIEPASCQGCGICASVCPRKAIVTRHYRDDQLIAKVEVLFGDVHYEAGEEAAGEAVEEA